MMRVRVILGLAIVLATAAASSADEGRILIGQRNFPLTITNSGSYLLTESVTNGSAAAISVNADHVTIDLGGHSIRGNRTIASGCISALDYYAGLRVMNGQIENFGNYAIWMGGCGRVENVRISNCGQAIRAGPAAMILNCQVSSNETAYGDAFLRAAQGSRIDGFSLGGARSSVNISRAIELDDGSLMEDVSICNVALTGSCWIVDAGSGSLVSRCSVKDCRTTGGSVDGIHTFYGCLLVDSLVHGLGIDPGINSSSSIESFGGALVLRCQAGGVIVPGNSVCGFFGNYGLDAVECSSVNVAGNGFELWNEGRVVRCTSSDHTNTAYTVVGGGVVFRENHAARTRLDAFYLRGFTSLLLLNSATRGGDEGFWDFLGYTNHYACVQSFPGMFYTFTTNTWANIRY